MKLKEEWQKEKKAWLKAGREVKKEDGIWKGYEVDGGKKRETRKRKGGLKKEEDDDDGDDGGAEVKKEADTGVRIKKEESGDGEEE